MAERANVSDEEMVVFKRKFFEGVEPPLPLAEMFGSEDWAKIAARLFLTSAAEVERRQASK